MCSSLRIPWEAISEPLYSSRVFTPSAGEPHNFAIYMSLCQELPGDKAHTADFASASQCLLPHRSADLSPGYFMLSYLLIYASTSRRGNRTIGSAENTRNALKR